VADHAAMKMTEQFRDLFVEEDDLIAIVSAVNTAYAVSRDWRLVFFNAPWLDLAEDHEGAADAARTWTLGASVEPALRGPAGRRIKEAIAGVFETGQWAQITCDRSQTDGYRRVRATLYPMGVGDSEVCLVTYATVVTVPHGERGHEAQDFVAARYVDGDGLVKMCCECRLCRRADGTAWDWVPDLVSDPHAHASHGLCDNCCVHWLSAWR